MAIVTDNRFKYGFSAYFITGRKDYSTVRGNRITITVAGIVPKLKFNIGNPCFYPFFSRHASKMPGALGKSFDHTAYQRTVIKAECLLGPVTRIFYGFREIESCHNSFYRKRYLKPEARCSIRFGTERLFIRNTNTC